jgi:hypothetical protein
LAVSVPKEDEEAVEAPPVAGENQRKVVPLKIEPARK